MIEEEVQIFGFGSFFRGSITYNDIDLLLLHSDLSPQSRQFALACKRGLSSSGFKLHITMLSSPEEKSLRFIERSSAEKIHTIRLDEMDEGIQRLLKIIKYRTDQKLTDGDKNGG
ncbi:hypothetical protein [Herbaspirillum seropedicae]|uniref:hypothetical protein n=1 Tax=Herbaspirillum seropedicae TaxID=964 RepID=UPI003D95FEDE